MSVVQSKEIQLTRLFKRSSDPGPHSVPGPGWEVPGVAGNLAGTKCGPGSELILNDHLSSEA